MPTQSDVLLMENYSSASHNGKYIISERLLSKLSSPVMMFPVTVLQCPAVRTGITGSREGRVGMENKPCSHPSTQAGRAGLRPGSHLAPTTSSGSLDQAAAGVRI